MAKQDWHAKGQQDRAKSRSDDWIDIIMHGGVSPHFQPPKDGRARDAYNRGRKNAERKK